MSKPLARYADDEDLEKMLKEREREGDPMLAFIKKKAETTQKRSGKAKKSKLLLITVPTEMLCSYTYIYIYTYVD